MAYAWDPGSESYIQSDSIPVGDASALNYDTMAGLNSNQNPAQNWVSGSNDLLASNAANVGAQGQAAIAGQQSGSLNIAGAEQELAGQQQQLASAQQQQGSSLWNTYQTVYKPLAQQIIQMAQQGLDPNKEAQTAGAAVTQSFGNQNASMGRQAASLGINPNSGRFEGLMEAQRIAEAAARAGAMTGARQNAINSNFTRLQQGANTAANLGNNLLTQSQGAYGNSTGALQAATQAQNASLAGVQSAYAPTIDLNKQAQKGSIDANLSNITGGWNVQSGQKADSGGIGITASLGDAANAVSDLYHFLT